MKTWMATAAALALLTSITAANAQNPPASTNDKSDKTTQQMNGAPSSKSVTKHTMKSRKLRHQASKKRSFTTGAGQNGTMGEQQYDPSIHQSKQRDSRGTPKGPGSDYNK